MADSSTSTPEQHDRRVYAPHALFRRPDGTKLEQGDLLVQPDLAKTLNLIGRDGTSVFYRGEIAEAIVAAQRRATTPGREGLMTLSDLADYDIEVESPISLSYRGYDVVGPRPSTNGGVVVLEALGLIREFRTNNPEYAWGFGTRNSLHVFLEAMRLAFADRDMWLGDERFSPVPTDTLLNTEYLADRSRLIGGETVMPGTPPPGNPLAFGQPVSPTPMEADLDATGHTTHFSIIDRWGNAVVMTSTLADGFGSGITVPGYGILLNDSLALFNLPQPRANPTTGNPGANDAGPGKRPMGSMAPTLILKDGEPFAATGTYSAAFIPSVVLNVVLNLLEYEMPLQAAVDAPRMWTGVARGDAAVNPGFASAIGPLRAMGHVMPHAGNVALNPAGGLATGSTGSFGVDLATFALIGAEDSTRFPDATTTVIERG